jgi:hypothetical protein
MNRLTIVIVGLCLLFTLARCQNSDPVATFAANSNTLADSTLSTNNITLSGDRFRQPNEAFYFFGRGERVQVNTPSYLPFIKDFSVSLWFRTKSQSRIEILSVNPGSATDNLNFDLSPTTGMWIYWNSGGALGMNIPELNLMDDEWHHLLFSRKGEDVRLYVDGEFKMNTTFAGPIGGSGNLLIGGGEEYPFEGWIDDIQIYSYALSDDAIINLYTARPFFAVPRQNSLVYGGQNLQVLLRANRLKSVDPGHVDLEVSYNNGASWRLIASNLSLADTLYTWAVPVFNGSRICKVRLKDSKTAQIIANSDGFKINVASVVTTYEWQQVTADAPFIPRDGAGAIIFNNSVWFMGGWNPEKFSTITTNELWKSTDGVTWEAKGNAPWEGRHVAGWVNFDKRIWLVGGDINQERYQTDEWYSDDGVTWTKVLDKLPWTARASHMVAAFNDKLWMVGGQEFNFGTLQGDSLFNDVWNSEDGIHWHLVTSSAPWKGRGFGKLVSFKNRLWLLGGGRYNEPQEFLNEVWSTTDGVIWTRHPNPPWRPRFFHESLVYDNKLWILGGVGDNVRNLSDVWWTIDGSTWNEVQNTPWPPRHAATAFVLKDELFIACGTAGNHPQELENDVWKLSKNLKIELPCPDIVIRGFEENFTIAVNGSNTYAYQWFKDSEPIPGQTFRSLDIREDGFYKLTVTDSDKSATSNEVRVLFTPKAELNINNDTTTYEEELKLDAYHDSTYAYTWYFQDEVVPGASSSSFTARFEGKYYLKVTSRNGIAAFSDPIEITFATNKLATDESHLVLDNAGLDYINMYYVSHSYVGRIMMEIIDLNGRLLASETSEKTSTTKYFTANIGNLPTGMYVAVVRTGDEKKSKKFYKK